MSSLRIKQIFSSLLTHPLARGFDLDHPETTFQRKALIQSKSYLRKIYIEWYQLIQQKIPEGDGKVLELGSGGGFLSQYYPAAITSDVFPIAGLDLVLNGEHLPFLDKTLKSIVMTNVFHHIPDVSSFLYEASRVLRPSGRLLMIEPWNTPWARFVYKYFHHEPFRPDTRNWRVCEKGGPLTRANGALPWIVFHRDKFIFENAYPQFRIIHLNPIMPFCYLLSGGVSLRNIFPSFFYDFIRGFENFFLHNKCAMFSFVALERV